MVELTQFRPLHAGLPLFGIAVLAACATAPAQPAREPVALKPAFVFAEAADTAPVTAWWTAFEDPLLAELVETALAANASLDAAEANVLAARALLSGAELARSPSTRTTASADLGRAAREDADVELTGSAGLVASWELDAFGRIAAEISAEAFSLEQAREARNDLAVIVAAETASAYADLRGAQRRLDVGRQNAEAQREGLELLGTLFENGRATRLDLERAEAQYRTTLASLPVFEAAIDAAAARLSALTAQDLPETLVQVEVPVDIPEHQGAILAGTPEDLLRRRPDIRGAEARIGRQLALGEVERARLFPTVTFSADVIGLFTEDSTADNSFGFGIGPAIVWDGPDLRRVRADIDVADARALEAIALYEQTVRDALAETEIALSAYARERARRADLTEAAAAARRALDLASLRFEEGLDDYLDVLDAQRTLLDAEDRLAASRVETTRRAIAAYRALGGILTDQLALGARLETDDTQS